MTKLYLWLGRFVGTAILIYSVFLLGVTIGNLVSEADYDSGLVVAWILSASIVGLVSSLLFLLSIDGPMRFMSPKIRLVSWWAMFLSILLPSSISFFLAPLTATTIGLSFRKPQSGGGRHLKKK